jgi:hypothetical protein
VVSFASATKAESGLQRVIGLSVGDGSTLWEREFDTVFSVDDCGGEFCVSAEDGAVERIDHRSGASLRTYDRGDQIPLASIDAVQASAGEGAQPAISAWSLERRNGLDIPIPRRVARQYRRRGTVRSARPHRPGHRGANGDRSHQWGRAQHPMGVLIRRGHGLVA